MDAERAERTETVQTEPTEAPDAVSDAEETKSETAKPKISIILKTPKEKQTIEVDEDAKIEDIKATAAEKFSADPEYLCLIFAGKLMEDSETLETHSIKNGMTIHLIIKTAPREPEAGPQRPPAQIGQTPYGFGAIGGLAGLDSLGMGSANFMELQNRLQTELIQNPELLKRVLDNPLVNAMMGDIENMKKLIMANPQMKDLTTRHPEIKYMLNNPDLLKQTAELAKNPSMLQELMRSADGCPREDIEGGYQTLPSVYNAFQGSGLTSAQEKVAQAQQRNDAAGVFNNPQMSSLLQQMAENPQAVQNMLQAPYTQAVLQAMSADPSMAAALVNENPWYRGNPELQKYVSSMMPQLVNQLRNPEILNMMANPQAVNALMHIQEGMEQLQNAAPALIGNLGLGPFGDFTRSDRSETPEEPPQESPKPAPDSFSQFMSRMITGMSHWDPNAPPEDKFKLQLEYMKAMGFQNEEKNLQMLTATFGDINAAVQKILAQQNN